MELTMPSLLKENYEKWGDKVWMRKKELGFWREYTWKDGYEKVKHFSLGLISLGFQWGDHMAIVGDNDPHWFWAELAAQCAGGAVTGPFSSSLPNELKYYVEHSDSKFVVVQDQEQVDKMLQIKDELPHLKKVIYWDPAGMRFYDDPLLMSFDDVSRLGQEYEATHPGLFEQSIERVKGEDTALIQYTSGTTGLPKGAVTTYANLGSQNEIFYAMNPMDERDEWLSFILPGWMAEQGLGLLGSMNRGLRLNFPEELATVPENIREIGPTVLFYASRLWEGTASTIQNRIMESTWLKRALYHFCLPIGYRAADAKFKGERLNLFWGALYGLAKLAVFNPLKDKLGFSKIRYAFTAGALLGPEIFRFVTAMGLDLRQMYGSSESPGGTQHTVDDIKVDSVGRVNPQTLIRICDDNHILLAGPSGSRGYYKNPEASAKTWAAGWYHTGDAGHLDEDGHLYYLDRLEYMSQLADGTKFAPQFIEARLKFSPYVRDAFVVGDETKDFVGVVINVDYDNVGHWAERRRIPYTTFADLSQKPEVCQLIRGEVENLNKKLPEKQRVRRFINMPKEFDPDEAELTRTMKIRRGFMEDRYKGIIEALYGERERMTMEVPVVYRDGRQAVINAEIQVTYLD